MAAPVQVSHGEETSYVLAITCEQMKDAEDHLHEYILAWLDTAMGDDTSAFNLSLGLLRTVQQVFTFNNSEKCFDYLSSIMDKRLFLVLSCTIDELLLNKFLVLPQLEYIYLFGKDAILKIQHSKLVEVTTIEKLYSRLNTHVQLCIDEEEKDDTDFASIDSNSASAPIKGAEGGARIFIFYQFLIEILLRLPKTPETKERFISFCMEKTSDNPAQKKIFQEFIDNYKPDEAITWYTRPCFLHKLLNRTCRLGNIKDMFKLAFFMIDLNAQLKSVHEEYIDCYSEHVHVYRGRPMSISEFEKLKASIGDLVVTKSFLSTTMKEDVALMYSGAGTTNATFVPAVIHMRIDKRRNETKPFAFTRYHSKVKADDEILISMGTIFRVDDEQCKNGVHEFILVRGDAEEQFEREMKNTFNEQTTKEGACFQSNSPADIDGSCKRVLETLTSSNNQAVKPLKGALSSSITQESDTENSDGTDEVSSLLSNDVIIEGRLLPTSEPYCQHSFRVRFTLPSAYPFEPPKLRFLDPMYHPNIDKNGKICLDILNEHDGYKPTKSLYEIIIRAERLIVDPNLDHVINFDAGVEYEKNRDKFNRTALEFVLRYGHPRI